MKLITYLRDKIKGVNKTKEGLNAEEKILIKKKKGKLWIYIPKKNIKIRVLIEEEIIEE